MFSLKKSLNRALLAVFVLSLVTGFFTGCSNGSTDDVDLNTLGELPPGLVGKWIFDADSYYELTETAGKTKLHYHADFGEYGDYSFDSTIEFVSNYNTKSGVIIVEITDGEYNPSKPYCGIYYKELTSNRVFLANALESDYSPADTVTLVDAIFKFTPGKVGNYIHSWGSGYDKEE